MQLKPQDTIAEQVVFTQGDTPVLGLVACDQDGNPVDLTGQSLSTEMLGPQGQVITIPNSQHTIVAGTGGLFSIALTALNTAAIGTGVRKSIFTIATGTGDPAPQTTYRGFQLLTVYGPQPLT